MTELGDVSAVVLNFNGRQLLELILPTLEAQTLRPAEIVVVDNGSSDDSLDYLRSSWPAVRTVEIRHNIGVAAALNRGVAAARGEYVALLNNDIELDPQWLKQLVGALGRHPEAGSVACKLRNFYRREELDGAGDVFLRAGAGAKRGHGELDRGQYDDEDAVLAPTGGAGLYRRTALEEVGPFDETLYAYFEDVDWGIRAQGLGFGCVYVPGAVGYHMDGRTTGGTSNPRYHALQWRNTVGLLVRNVPLGWILRHAPWIAAHQIAGLWRSARAGMLRSHLSGLAQAARALPAWVGARRALRRARRVSGAQLSRALAAGRERTLG